MSSKSNKKQITSVSLGADEDGRLVIYKRDASGKLVITGLLIDSLHDQIADVVTDVMDNQPPATELKIETFPSEDDDEVVLLDTKPSAIQPEPAIVPSTPVPNKKSKIETPTLTITEGGATVGVIVAPTSGRTPVPASYGLENFKNNGKISRASRNHATREFNKTIQTLTEVHPQLFGDKAVSHLSSPKTDLERLRCFDHAWRAKATSVRGNERKVVLRWIVKLFFHKYHLDSSVYTTYMGTVDHRLDIILGRNKAYSKNA